MPRCPTRARERVAAPLAEAFAHTYWYALALTAAALVPGLLLAREEARARRRTRTAAAGGGTETPSAAVLGT